MKKNTRIGLVACLLVGSHIVMIDAATITENAKNVNVIASPTNVNSPIVKSTVENKNDKGSSSPAKPNEPIVMQADKMKYVGNSGDVLARGRVDITQGQQYIGTDLVEGNTKTQLYSVPGVFTYKNVGMHFTGNSLSYDGNTRLGKMEHIEGLMDKLYLRGVGGTVSNMEDNKYGYVAHGMVTTKSAMAWQNPPDYRIDGENILIVPNDRIEVSEAKFFIRNWHFLTLKKLTTSLKKRSKNSSPFNLIPTPSYKTADGFGLRGGIAYPLGKDGEIFANYAYYTKVGFKPNIGVAYYLPWGDASLSYSKETSTINDRNVWVVKRPELKVNFKEQKLGNSGLYYSGRVSYGYWSQGSVKGPHNLMRLDLRINPIKLSNKVNITANAGYQRDYYGYNHVTRTMPFGQVRLNAAMTPKLSTFIGYNVFDYKGNTPYTFDTIDNRHFIDGGLYFQATRKDGFGYYVKYDTDLHRMTDQVISYSRDMHSMVGMIAYNTVNHKYDFKLTFKDFNFSIG